MRTLILQGIDFSPEELAIVRKELEDKLNFRNKYHIILTNKSIQSLTKSDLETLQQVVKDLLKIYNIKIKR